MNKSETLDINNPQGSMNVIKENHKTLNILNSTIKFPGQISKYILFEKFVAVLLNYMEDDSKSNLSGGNIFFANENGIFWQLPSIRRIYMSNIWKKDNNTLGIYDGQYDLWLNINTKEYTKEIPVSADMLSAEFCPSGSISTQDKKLGLQIREGGQQQFDIHDKFAQKATIST